MEPLLTTQLTYVIFLHHFTDLWGHPFTILKTYGTFLKYSFGGWRFIKTCKFFTTRFHFLSEIPLFLEIIHQKFYEKTSDSSWKNFFFLYVFEEKIIKFSKNLQIFYKIFLIFMRFPLFLEWNSTFSQGYSTFSWD